MTYDYHKPSGVNGVSIFLLLLLAGGIYAAAKFIPVYWSGKKVDSELDEVKMPAVGIAGKNDDARRALVERIVAQAVAHIHDLGIEDQADQPVEVWFTPDYSELHARYQMVVTHPGNIIHPTVMNMERAVEVPR